MNYWIDLHDAVISAEEIESICIDTIKQFTKSELSKECGAEEYFYDLVLNMKSGKRFPLERYASKEEAKKKMRLLVSKISKDYLIRSFDNLENW